MASLMEDYVHLLSKPAFYITEKLHIPYEDLQMGTYVWSGWRNNHNGGIDLLSITVTQFLCQGCHFLIRKGYKEAFAGRYGDKKSNKSKLYAG